MYINGSLINNIYIIVHDTVSHSFDEISVLISATCVQCEKKYRPDLAHAHLDFLSRESNLPAMCI